MRGILRALERAGIVTLADKGYQGAQGPVVTPHKGRNKPASRKRANRSHARLRGSGERANARLKSWRLLRKIRCSSSKAGQGVDDPNPLASAVKVIVATGPGRVSLNSV
ncbi:transposase family protein [Streptosporangium sandarakinum]|uniref:transposase family protein n=1 Tax=Streptosporangium sandarakinum TaxID=1260955 RepID=UPI0037B46239